MGKVINYVLLTELNTDFTLNNCLFWSVKLTKNADLEKYKYSAYGIGFDSRSEFSLTGDGMGKMLLLMYMRSSVHIGNKHRDILILGEELTRIRWYYINSRR